MVVIIVETSPLLDSGPILGLLNASEKIRNAEACEPFWDNESHSPRAKSVQGSPNSLKSKAQAKANKKKKFREIPVSLWHAGNMSLNSPVDWVGGKRRLFLYYFSPSNQPSSPRSQSIDTSITTLMPVKRRTYFPL